MAKKIAQIEDQKLDVDNQIPALENDNDLGKEEIKIEESLNFDNQAPVQEEIIEALPIIDEVKLDVILDILPELKEPLSVNVTALDFEKQEEIIEVSILAEFKEYTIVLTKKFVGQIEGTEKKVSGNVAMALIKKGVAVLK